MLQSKPQVATVLTADKLMASYAAVAELYGDQPPLSLWRTWEHAVYHGRELAEPVLDLGCGDSRFFRLLWPNTERVTGCDLDTSILAAARAVDGYPHLTCCEAASLPFERGTFGTVFSNCVLEHLGEAKPVVSEVLRCLRPEGTFIFSIITDKLLDFFESPWSKKASALTDRAKAARAAWTSYHTISRVLSMNDWSEMLHTCGFEVLEAVGILPENSARLFLFLDELWHTKTDDGEAGSSIKNYLESQNRFHEAFAEIVRSFFEMEPAGAACGGAVFSARKPS